MKLHELAPYLWYLAGSVCFAVGTLIVIVRVWRSTPEPAPVPRPIETHGCATFWYDHGCPRYIGDEINVEMVSGRTAVFRLVKAEQATGVDWYWYTFDFVRYLPLEKPT